MSDDLKRMNISIEALKEEHAEELFQFECKNRAFFEKMVPSRGDGYYDYQSFLERHQALIDEQINGESYFYLIRNAMGSIVGRVNLVDIDRQKHSGDIGYRVGEDYTGQGIAAKSVRLLLMKAPTLGVTEVQRRQVLILHHKKY